MIGQSRIILMFFWLWGALGGAIGWAQTSLIDRIQRTESSIVTVRTALTRLMPGDPPKAVTYERTATGLIIDVSGIIVTNTHTILHAPSIDVTLQDGTKLAAKLIYANEMYDFSFLQITPPHPLRRVRWADSSVINVGDAVIAVGNADVDHRSIMQGHVTSIYHSRSAQTNDFFELDLDLYHGDSGGPILDNKGRLLGMIMAKRESVPHASLAIAANKIHQQYWQLKKSVP